MEYKNNNISNTNSRVNKYKHLYDKDKTVSNSSINITKNTIKNKTNINNVKTSNKKKKNNSKKLLILLIIIILLVIINYMNKNNKDEKKKEDNTIINDNNTKDNKQTLNEKDIKLNKLENINQKIDFFKDEYIDRYIDYKEKNPNLDTEKVIVYVNIGLDKNFYSEIKDSPNKKTNQVLVNKYNYLGEDYIPDLEKINEKYTSDKRYMTKEAATAFEQLAKDAAKEGYNIRAVSTYRSYKYQTELYNKYKQQDGEEKADTYSARPGYSEHQTGLAVDVDNKKVSYTSFGKTKEFEWMKKNAYKYGFILRYTKEYEPITGYMNEPWHYRYVGKEIAEYIQNNPMTYEEYYVRFLDKKNNE